MKAPPAASRNPWTLDRRTLIAGAAALPLAGCVTGRAADGASFRIVTYNIFHNAGDWPARRPLLLETLRAAEPDVLVLQEVLEDADAALPNQGATIAAALGPDYSSFFSSADAEGGRRRGGNAIVTRLPVIARDWKRLDPISDNRTAQRVRLRIAGRAIDVVNTHLAWQPDADPMRARQIADLAGWLPRDGTPLVAAGDFNAALGSPSQRPLIARGLVSALPPGAATTTFVADPDYPPMVIDHIFVERGRFAVTEVGLIGERPTRGVYPSDHYGLAATLRITG